MDPSRRISKAETFSFGEKKPFVTAGRSESQKGFSAKNKFHKREDHCEDTI